MNDFFFAKAFEKSAVGMAFLQDDGKVISANPALVQILEKDLWLIVGAGLGDHMTDGNSHRWETFFSTFLVDRTAEHYFESPFQPRGDREAWWSLQLGDLGMEWAGRKTVFVLIEDITFKKVNERQLREARRLAETASRAKSQFLANMSHEIRTPLFTIAGTTELLLSGKLARDQAHYVHQIENAANQLLDLVNDVLDLSKIEAGQMSLETIPFDLDDVLAHSLGVVGLTAFRKGLELVLDLDPSVPRQWLGDPSRFRQTLVNLLSNAVKFTENGHVLVRVRHQENDAVGNETIQIRVEDSGPGLSEAAEQNLFQVFVQGDSSTTRQFGGTGLGLAISQKLVRMLGGEIGYHSEKNKGTEFFFSLPFKRLQDPELPWGNQGRGREIWLVDDHAISRELMETALRWAGYRVRVAESGAEFRRIWEDREGRFPVAVLIDEDLGGEDAFDVAQRLKADPAASDISLVLLSVLSRSAPFERSFLADFFSCTLDKPVNPRVLVEVLTSGLDGLWKQNDLRPDKSLVTDETTDSRPVRIAIAEDNDVNRELFLVLLHRLGCEIYSAVDGEAILETVGREHPDLVFMDIQMPKLSGYEAASRLRKDGLKCPIVAVTASALKGELERCLSAGMNGILTKPFKLENLRDVLVTFLPGRGPFLEINEPETSIDSIQSQPEGFTVFDWDEAQSVFLGNRDLVLSLLRRFLPRTRETLQRLIYALDLGNLDEAAQAAHAIKGSAFNLTAKVLGATASDTEQAARDGNKTESLRFCEKLESDFYDFETMVSPFLK